MDECNKWNKNTFFSRRDWCLYLSGFYKSMLFCLSVIILWISKELVTPLIWFRGISIYLFFIKQTDFHKIEWPIYISLYENKTFKTKSDWRRVQHASQSNNFKGYVTKLDLLRIIKIFYLLHEIIFRHFR